jgi:outer membrane receptor for monomeric catechols
VNLASHPTASTFPTFNFADGTITSIGQDRVGKTISGTVELTDNLTRIQGKHTFRFGLDIRRQRYNALMYFVPSDDYGNFTFSGNLTNYSYGDFLLGLPNPSFFAVIGPQMDAQTFHWGVYGQDTWQVNRHLTVNYGLRWEFLPPFVETNGVFRRRKTSPSWFRTNSISLSQTIRSSSRFTMDFFKGSTHVRFRKKPRCSRVRTSRRPAMRGFLKAFGIIIGAILTHV